MMTTCLTCNIPCDSSDLDINSECQICQAKFSNKMRAKATSGKGKTKEQKSYLRDIPLEIRGDILIDATNLYKIKCTSKVELIKRLNKDHGVYMTGTVFDMLAKPENLRKYGLTWKYKK